MAELGNYEPELLERPALVVGSRAPIMATTEQRESCRAAGHFRRDRRRHQLAARPPGLTGRRGPGSAAPAPPDSRSTGQCRLASLSSGAPTAPWLCAGRQAERAVALSDLTDAGALAYAQGRLRHMGVDRALVRAGARQGDRVRIGRFEFDWEPD